MKNQGECRHKLLLFWRQHVGLSAAGSCPQHWGTPPSFPCNAISMFCLLFSPFSWGTQGRQAELSPHVYKWHRTARPLQGGHWGCGRSVQPLRAGTTESSAHSELFGRHSHILNFAVPEKGLDLLRMIKCSASFLKCLRHCRVGTL